jgi:NodT family efflux transporter outer membrane factor (OMF) lipoprotein
MATDALRRLALTGLAALLGACTVGPDYRRPELAAPAQWSPGATAPRPDATSVALPAPFDGRQWWSVFGDPLLDQLVQEAAQQNIDLQTAALRIEQARVQRVAAGSAAYPSVALSGVAGRTRMSENGIAGALGGGGSSGSGAQGASKPSLTTSLYQAGFDATWELDLWGRVRRNVEAADADIASAEAAKRDALVSLSAEITRSYLALRGIERQLAIARADLATQQRVGELVASRRRAGFAAEAEVSAQSAQIQAVLAQLPTLEQNLAQAKNRLALLLALPPGALEQRLKEQAAVTRLPPTVPVGLPGDLLLRRPDIRRREAELHSATARIGVAKARTFPSLQLGVLGGLQSTQLHDLTDWGSRFLLGGTQVSLPIFEGGQLRAQVRLADIGAQQAALAYRQTVLGAFHEVEDALVAYAEEQRRSAALQRQFDDAARTRELALSRWQSGLAAFTEVLDAERSAHQSEEQLAQSSVTASTDLVALFKALGGGWQDDGLDAGVRPPPPPSAARGP